MEKIIITLGNKVNPAVATSLVSSVLDDGKISKNKSGKQYCWVTSFETKYGKFVVFNKGRRKGSETDSFIVTKDTRKSK